MSYEEYREEFLEDGMDEELAEQMASYEACIDYEDSDKKDTLEDIEDWEILGLDPDTPQDEIDDMWDNQLG
jgi:hypothetical protein